MEETTIYTLFDTIKEFSSEAFFAVIEHPKDSAKSIFASLKKYFVNTSTASDTIPEEALLTKENLDWCAEYIKTCDNGYQLAMLFQGINTQFIKEVAQKLKDARKTRESEIISVVSDFVADIATWADNGGEEPVVTIAEREQERASVEDRLREKFDDLFKSDFKPHHRDLLYEHIKESATRHDARTYLGAIVVAVQSEVKMSHRDFTSTLRIFWEIDGIDTSNIKDTKKVNLGKKISDEAVQKIAEIKSHRAPRI